MIRDPRVVYLSLGLPVVMLILFGYAISTDIDHIPIAVVDQDHTRSSRRLIEVFVAGGVFVRVQDVDDPELVGALFRRGRMKAALIIPRGFQRDLARASPRGAQFLVDGSDGTTATVALGDSLGIVQSSSVLSETESGVPLAAGPRVRMRFNPSMRSTFNIVPGVIVLILAMVSALLAAMTVAREWERGSMEQLFATPVGRAEIILGKLLPYAALGFVQSLLVLTLGSYVFGVPIHGSLITLFLALTIFLLAMLAIGLLISVATKNQLVSVQAAVFASMLPALLLSGFLFPIQNMPFALRAFSALIPARYLVTILRGTMLKGTGIAVLGPDILVMAGFAVAVVAAAVGRFRRRVA